jgi:hypothetical protein
MNAVVSVLPVLNTPYTPSMIAMSIGFMSNQLPGLFSALATKIKEKLGL